MISLIIGACMLIAFGFGVLIGMEVKERLQAAKKGRNKVAPIGIYIRGTNPEFDAMFGKTTH